MMRRKNWPFCNTPSGAKGSNAYNSLIETARVNGLDQYRNLLHVLKARRAVPANSQIQQLNESERNGPPAKVTHYFTPLELTLTLVRCAGIKTCALLASTLCQKSVLLWHAFKPPQTRAIISRFRYYETKCAALIILALAWYNEHEMILNGREQHYDRRIHQGQQQRPEPCPAEGLIVRST